MNPANFTFSSKDNLSLFGRAWASEHNKPKGIVLLIHGLGEHTGRYDHVGKAFVKNGYHLIGFDLRGHGLSEGARGHAPGLRALYDDISSFIEESKQYLGNDMPSFLYGHSLGGNLVINYLIDNAVDVEGAIVTSPPLQLSTPQPKWKIALANFLGEKIPRITMKNGLEKDALSRNSAIVKAYENDSYVHDKISAGLGLILFETGSKALKDADRWNLPLLLMHGTADRITLHDASKTFAQKAGEQITFVSWKSYYHELHNDIDSEKVIEKMINWLDQQVT